MLLNKLIQRKRLTVLGINSGTSADSLDLCAVRISRTGNKKNISVLAHQSCSYPPSLKRQIHHQIHCNQIKPESIVQLDNILGIFIGLKAKDFIDKLVKQKIKIDLVASHGQTIRHIPGKIKIGQFLVNGTLQIGSLDQIAVKCNRIVTGDFRQADIAIGNEGAPITTSAMYDLFSSSQSRLIINIGGISNFFYIPSNKSNSEVVARDCGPGNSLCDILSERLFNRPYDKNGIIARKGNINSQLLTLLKRNPFFSNNHISTGREEFGQKIAEKIIEFGEKHRLSNEDLMTTGAELTVISIIKGIETIYQNDNDLNKLYLTGGGRKNIFFRKRLNSYFPEVTIEMVDKLGIDGDFVEATAFAVLGEACLRSESPQNYRHKDKRDILLPVPGHIVQPPNVRN